MYNIGVILSAVKRKLDDDVEVYIDADELLIECKTRRGSVYERFNLVQSNLEFTEDLHKAIQRLKDKLK